MKGLYINENNRAVILSVMSRIQEPRKLTEIAWHIPYVGLGQVAYTLDVMVIRGEVLRIADPNATIRYVLAPDFKTIPAPKLRGPDPANVVRNGIAFVAAIGAIAAALLILKSLPW